MRTIREADVGKLLLRLLEKDRSFVGLIFAADGGRQTKIQGDVADDVWRRLHGEAGKANSRYFGFNGARARFLRFFPGGFQSGGYTNQERSYAEWERNYKVKAKSMLERTAPLSQAAAGSGFGEAVLSVFRATNLLHHVEKTRLQRVLRGPGADTFIRAAARFTMGEMKPALHEMERVLKPYDSAKWTVVTYLPFLWRPEAHMS